MARRKTPEQTSGPTDAPPELRDQLHPIWRDLDALQDHPVLSEYVDTATVSRMKMGGRIYHHVLDAWATANGYTSASGLADWHELRTAGIIS